jgi:MFS family permease
MDLSNTNEMQDSILNLSNDPLSISKIEEKYQTIQIKEILEIIGEQSTFQYLTLIYFCLCTMFVASISFAMPFIYYVPVFYCKGKTPNILFQCTQEEACSNEFGYILDDSVRSATYEFNLVCDNKILMTRAQNVVFLVSGFGVYIFSILSDLWGRKPIFFLAFGLVSTGAFLVLVQNNFYLFILGHLIIYFGKYSYISVLYTFCTETMGGNLGKISITITFILYGMGQLILSGISFTKPFYKTYFTIYFVSFLTMFFLAFFMIETPFFKYKKRNFLEFYISCLKIAKINHRKREEYLQTMIKFNKFLHLPDDFHMQSLKLNKNKEQYTLLKAKNDASDNDSYVDEFETHKQLIYTLSKLRFEETNVKTNNLKKICKREILKKIVTYSIVLTPIYFVFGEFFLIAQKIGLDNIGKNGLILGSIDICFNTIVAFTVSKINPRKNHIYACIGFTILSFSIFASDLIFKFSDSYQEKKPVLLNVIQTSLSLSMKVIVCFCFGTMFTYLNRLFPTEIRAIGSGACLLYSRVFMSFTTYFIYFTDKHHFHPLSFAWILSAIGTVAAFFCPNLKADKTDN